MFMPCCTPWYKTASEPPAAAQVFSLLALELKVFPELAREDGVKGIAFRGGAIMNRLTSTPEFD